MPYPDAKYPPAKVEADDMRQALVAIRHDCEFYMSPEMAAYDPYFYLLHGFWDCARTALGEGEK